MDVRLGGPVSLPAPSLGASEPAGGGDRRAIRMERQLERLASKLAAEAEERRRLEQRLEGLATELTALRASGHQTPQAAASNREPVADAATAPAASAAAGPADAAHASTSMERALAAAGVDPGTAADIKRRRDELALSEIYLRDQAVREGWLDTPRFGAEMADIEQQRTSVRDEIGDEAYDRYLAALNQPNRVAVDEVLLESPAAASGLQAGDVVWRYGETRIFAPNELVTATRGGVAGEAVRVEIVRQGRRFEIDVPRGPLGIRITASHGDPNGG